MVIYVETVYEKRKEKIPKSVWAVLFRALLGMVIFCGDTRGNS